jgi:hypothetical protein
MKSLKELLNEKLILTKNYNKPKYIKLTNYRIREIKEAFVDWTNPDSYTDENIIEKLNTADGLKTFVKNNIDNFIDYAHLTDDEFYTLSNPESNDDPSFDKFIEQIIRVNKL